jgi:capsid protein
MKMSKQFRQIVLQNAIFNSTFAATIESDTLDPSTVFQMLGGSDATPEAVQRLLTGYMAGHYQTMGELMGGSKNLNIDGVRIPHLPPGTKLNLNGAGKGGPLGTSFEIALNRVMAAALGLSYEQFSRDYSNTNYSSARAAMSETYKGMLSIKRAVADRFASEIYRLWMEEMLNDGAITSIRRRMPSWYEGRNKEWYSACDWVGASRGQIDELKETQAAILRLNNGISTLEIENARLGQDWRKQLRQLKREQEWKDAYQVLQGEKNQDTLNALSGNKNEKEVGDE